ncbi:MAG: type II toxin-antitoxin system RatA family toxin [Gammaproteobacteria bacterium]|nr:type II toxin-antitoxin system RatA family toxin [Gammaproteobacteria bacterium]
MPVISRSALLPYPATVMFDIVNQVEAYPEFLPWCGGTRLHRADETSMEASIQISVAGLDQWFKTRNSMVPGESIEITLVDGPFKQLHGQWQFTPIDRQGCKIELTLEFEFKRGLTAAVIAPAFTRIANTMVDSFCDRARELYG